MADQISREEWEQLVNDVKHVRASTQSMNRIMVTCNSELIKKDILNTINGSMRSCAALFFSKELLSAKDLADKIGIDVKNLSRQIKPLLDKSYIIPNFVGRNVFYQREEKVDLVGFDNFDEVKALMREWQEKGRKE